MCNLKYLAILLLEACYFYVQNYIYPYLRTVSLVLLCTSILCLIGVTLFTVLHLVAIGTTAEINDNIFENATQLSKYYVA